MARQSRYSKRRVPGGKTFPKYAENLQAVGNTIFSYGTPVADYKNGKVVTRGWWSSTTSKHINYVAGLWGAKVVKKKK